MSTRQETCFVISCDGCAGDLNQDEGVPHFSTEQAAIDAVTNAEWEVTGGRVLCGDCQAKIGCQLLGHCWDPWRPSATDPAIVWRTCGACGAWDRTLRALLSSDSRDIDNRGEGTGC